MAELNGKVALVTGASRGIGAAIALRFAEAGADIAITYHASPGAAEEVATAARRYGVRAEAIKADAGDPAAVRHAVQSAAASFGGRLDILVNNAGIFLRKPLPEATEEEFDAVMAVNVRGVFIGCREAVLVMGDGGRIINLGSSFGARVPAPGLGLYAMSKFAVAGLTRALARDLAPRGITVNAIQPGPISTDMNPADDRHSRIMAMMTAVGRYGKPEDVANVALFLALPQSHYITGAILPVDGGFET